MSDAEPTTEDLVRVALRDAAAAVEERASQRYQFPDEEGRIAIVAEAAVDFVAKRSPMLLEFYPRVDLVRLAVAELTAANN